MCFDRYEIHIQAFGDFIYAHFIFCPILIFTKIFYDNLGTHIFKKQNEVKRTFNKIKKHFVGPHIHKDNMFPGGSHNFLVFFEAFWLGGPRF